MKKIICTINLMIILFLISGCSETGLDGESFISIGTASDIESFDNLNIEITFDNFEWDGEWDYNSFQDSTTNPTLLPSQSIDPGNYEYMVRVTYLGVDENSDGEDDYVIRCSPYYVGPDDALYDNFTLIIEPNEKGEDAPTLFEDGASGQDRHYSFSITKDGWVSYWP